MTINNTNEILQREGMDVSHRDLSRAGKTLALALLAATSLTAVAQAADLKIGLGVATIANLDPTGTVNLSQGNMQALKQIFDTLVVYDNGAFVPSVATEWTSSEDAKEWTFKLRDDVVFSDGSKLEADDVVASAARLVENAGALAGIFKPLTLTAVGPHELKVTSETGQGALLGKLSMLGIAPSELVATEDFGLKPVGSGPFVVSSFDPNTGVELDANPNYWGGAPKIDGISFKLIAEQSARLTALETGEIDLAWDIPEDQFARISALPNIETVLQPTMSNVFVWFNSSRDVFAKPEVRRAFWKAVDYAGIVEALYPNTGTLMEGPLPADVFGASIQTPYPYDPEAARADLEAAGYDFSQPVRILMNNPTFLTFMQAVVADWQKIGINADVDLVEAAVGSKRVLELDWDMVAINVVTSTGDADYNLGRLYTCAANRTGYCDETLDQLLAEAGSTPDQDKRVELYNEAGKIVWDQAVGMYPMTVTSIWAWNDKVDGVVPSPILKPSFKDVTIAE